MPMSPRLLRPRHVAQFVSNADAQDWVNRVYAAGGTVSQRTADAVNTFCNTINSTGLRDRFYRLNLFCGNDLTACLVPLYCGPSLTATQLGNTTDTNNNFAASDYAETGASGGLLGNGSSKYLDTGFNVNNLTASSIHLSSYIRGTQDISSARALIGALWNSAADRYRIFLSAIGSTAPNFSIQSELGKVTQASAVNRANTNAGHIVSSRTSTTSLTLYDDATSIATNTDATAETVGAFPFLVFARTGPTEYYNGRMAAYSIGLGLTGPQVAAFNTAMQAFQAALSRSV